MNFKKYISYFYTPYVEDLCTRLLYVINTLDSYFLAACLIVWVLVAPTHHLSYYFFFILLFSYVFFKVIADFHPYFIVFSVPAWLLLFYYTGWSNVLQVIAFHTILAIGILYIFIGIPNSIISRDFRVGFMIIYNSLFTFAPTNCSFPITLFFSAAPTLLLLKTPGLKDSQFFCLVVLLLIASIITYVLRPKNFITGFSRIPSFKKYFDRVVVLNIDGCRYDYVKDMELPNKNIFENSGIFFKNGLKTIYRALTNPAFCTILTSSFPNVHKVIHNRYDQHIMVEALPDYINSILYGSMHVKHFSKSHWQNRIVSIPMHSIYNTDEVVFEMIKNDMVSSKNTRLFIADLSEVDSLGHCYGGYSTEYKNALKLTFHRIGVFLDWCKKNNQWDNTAFIICSDHGIAVLDHSFLLYDSEIYVPFYAFGNNIKKIIINKSISILNIGNTLCHLLGERYPKEATGDLLFCMGDKDEIPKFSYYIRRNLHHYFNTISRHQSYTKWITEQFSIISECYKTVPGAKLKILIIDFEGIASLVKKYLNENYVGCEVFVSERGENINYDENVFDSIILLSIWKEDYFNEKLFGLLNKNGTFIVLNEPDNDGFNYILKQVFYYIKIQCELRSSADKEITDYLNLKISDDFKQNLNIKSEEIPHAAKSIFLKSDRNIYNIEKLSGKNLTLFKTVRYTAWEIVFENKFLNKLFQIDKIKNKAYIFKR